MNCFRPSVKRSFHHCHCYHIVDVVVVVVVLGKLIAFLENVVGNVSVLERLKRNAFVLQSN